MNIVFDIETMPNSSMIDRLPEPDVKTGNLKDPAKIAEKVEEARAEQISRMALNPLYGRVCAAVLIADDDSCWNDICISNDSDNSETDAINSIFASIGDNRLVTYNGNGFDLPFIYRRAVILGIDPREFSLPTLAEMTARYNNKHHIDLMTAWAGFSGFEKLDNIVKVLFGDQKIEIDFKDFPELIKTPEGRKRLLAYCGQDVRLTQKLWNRVSGILI